MWRCSHTRSKKLLVTSATLVVTSATLVVTSALLVVTGALLVVTMFAIKNSRSPDLFFASPHRGRPRILRDVHRCRGGRRQRLARPIAVPTALNGPTEGGSDPLRSTGIKHCFFPFLSFSTQRLFHKQLGSAWPPKFGGIGALDLHPTHALRVILRVMRRMTS